jgi:YegS/Rv2252/BmrU family lipid kinase
MAKTHAKIIVNPVAGANGSTFRQWPHIKSLLQESGLTFDFQYTEGTGHASELARLAASDGYRFLVAVGGDGTINEVANGLLDSTNAGTTTMGIVSTGTGNDFIKSLGIPKDYIKACQHVTGERRSLIDVGLVEFQLNGQKTKRYFVNGAGVGFDAEVAEAGKSVPRFMGNTVPFVLALLKTLPRYRNKDIRMNIDGRRESRRVLSLIVSNGAYFGGGMRIAPEAELGDRKLDVLTIGDIGKAELLQVFPRVYKGTHTTHPKVRMEKAERVTIECDRRILLQADGELLGEGPVTFQILPAALTVVA